MAHQLIQTKNGLDEIQNVRKRNLRTLIKQHDGPTKLAAILRYSGPSFLSQMVGPNKPVTENTARGIEQILELPDGWMDTDHTAPPRPVAVPGAAIIGDVLTSVSAALADVGVTLPPQVTEIVSLAYEHTAARGQVDDAYIRRLTRLAVETG